jgi:hypothetical protein
VHDAFIFLAICGVTYGGYALYSLGGFGEAQREEIRRKEKELASHILEGGVSGLVFRLGQPVYWLVALPARSVLAALGVAALLVLPALLAK